MSGRLRTVATRKIELTQAGLAFTAVDTEQRLQFSWPQVTRPAAVTTVVPRGCLINLGLLIGGSAAIWLVPWLALKIVAGVVLLLTLLIRLRGMYRGFLEVTCGEQRWRLCEVDAAGKPRTDDEDPFYYDGLANDIQGHLGILPQFSNQARPRYPISAYRCLGCAGSAFEQRSEGVYQCHSCGGVLELYDAWFCPDSEVKLTSQLPCRWAADQRGAPSCAACAVTTKICLEVDGVYYRCPNCDAAWYPKHMGTRLFH